MATAVLCGSSVWLAWASIGFAQDLALPAPLEAKLSASAAAYERTLPSRARGKVSIAVLANPAEPDSVRAAKQMERAFADVGAIGGLPHVERVLLWTDAAVLVDTCIRENVSIVFVAPGLHAAIGAIAKALEPTRTLTIAGFLPYLDEGLVLGFDLVSGRPKLVVNLSAAKKQGLEFRSDLLRLARVIK